MAVEREMLKECELVLGFDEVGRGALAGPVGVGVVAVTRRTLPIPQRLADSKLLSAAIREGLVQDLHAWVAGHAMGTASAAEIDALGIMRALRLAAERAFAALDLRGITTAAIVDGPFDWLSRPEISPESPGAIVTSQVVTKVKADQSCASVAAASVLAKVTRDLLMSNLSVTHPGYFWEANKGYGTMEHRAAIARLGPTDEHRQSWKLLPVD
jgi:ribonuclease HII